jgi:uncharacterized protein YggE
MKLLSIAVLGAALATAVAFAGVGRPGDAHGSSAPTDRTVTVSATGTARGAPDTAHFTFGVETEGATAKAATAANAAKMRSVIAALRRQGIAAADLRTEDVSVYPRRSDTGVLEGYAASSTLSVTLHRVAKAGAIVDVAVAAGADDTSGPQFDRSSKLGLTQLALREAFANARAKAETLAREADAQLGEVQRIDATEAQPQPMPLYADTMRAAATPVQPGTEHVQASVTVTFSLS